MPDSSNNPVELLWLQGKLLWTLSIESWTKPYHRNSKKTFKNSSVKPDMDNITYMIADWALGGVSILIQKNVTSK